MPERPIELVDDVRAGRTRAAAKLISAVEDRLPGADEAMDALAGALGDVHIIGVTGAPGTGKSTLTDQLVDHYRDQGHTVGVVAVDPTSPYTGGALLGDRIRMATRSTDPDVFIRSLGSRGALGGLSRATNDVVRVLAAMGKDVVIVETVGVGQGEVDVVRTADSVVLTVVPGLGDDIQNIKAGIMEIADVFCVNKADRPDTDRTVAQLTAWLRLAHENLPEDAWRAPIVETVATEGAGTDALVEAIAAHRAHLEASGGLAAKRRERAEHEVLTILKDTIVNYVMDEDALRGRFESLVADVAAGKVSPQRAARRVFEDWDPGAGRTEA